MAKMHGKDHRSSSKTAKTKAAAKKGSKSTKTSSKKSQKKKTYKTTAAHAATSGAKKAQKTAKQTHKGPTAAEKKAMQQRDQAQKAAAEANKRANAAAKKQAGTEKALGAAQAQVQKTNSALAAQKKAAAAASDRAAAFESENQILLAERAVKIEANKALQAEKAQMMSVISAFESEEAKMARQINEQTLAMQEQAQAILDSLNDEADEPPVTIDGISSGYASPAPAEKLYQDQTAVEIDIDTIDNLDDLSISVLRPEILVNHKGSFGTKDSTSGIGSNKYLDLFAGNVLRELLHTDAAVYSFTQFQDVDPDLVDAASQRVDDVYTNIEEEVASLVAYRSMINQAAVALDLHQCSEEIGSLMIDSVSEVMQPEDGFVENLPSTLVDLVAASDNVKSNIESSYSNSKLYFSLLATIHESFSGYGSHLGQKEKQSTKPMTYEGSSRDKYSLARLKANQVNQTKSGNKSVVRQGFTAIFPEISKSSLIEDLQKYLCCLSNELLISCGINRLAGTELGNKYGVTSDHPLQTVIGTNMEKMYGKGGVSIPEIDPKKGSLLDFITSEDTDSSRVVLPFEVNDITLSKKKYLPGSDYLVEAPARKLDISFNDPIGQFAENFSGEVTSSKKYLEDLLALTESTLLSPQGILIRILEDVYTICLEGAKAIDFMDRNAMLSAVKLSIASGKLTQKLYGGSATAVPKHRMCATDTNAIIQTAMAQEEQPDYRLSLDLAAKDEIENTDSFYKTRKDFNHAFNNYWRLYIGELKSDTTSTNVLGVNRYQTLKITIESESETRTVHKMIIDLADEIMSEAQNFASRDGIEASYMNNEGKTAASNLDYSALIAMIQQLYHVLIKNMFHWSPITRSGYDYKKAVRIDTESNKVTSDAILAILNTYKEGAMFEDLFDEEGNALAIEGVSSSTKIGKNITMGQLADCVDSLRNHRTYIKCCLAALEGIASNISQKSSPLSSFQASAREVITNATKIENVKDASLASFCSLVKLPVGSDALRGLTAMQCSNTILSKARLEPSGLSPVEKRQKRAVLSSGLLEAMRVFHETEMFRSSQNIVCVGLPNGMMDKLKTSNVDEKKREQVSESSNDFSIVFSCDNELFSSLVFEDHEVEFDSSLYLFPDSYDGYTPPEEDEGGGLLRSPDPLRDLIDKTVFHRIVSGVIIESETGKTLIEQGNDRTFEILKNHVYSDLTRVSIEFALMMGISEADIKKYSDLNVACYSTEGYELMRSMQSNTSLNMMIAGIENVLEPILIDESNVFYRMGTSNSNRNAYNMLTENDQNDMVRFASSSLFTAELDRHKILSTSIFDRVFYVQVNQDDFVLDEKEGLSTERKRFSGDTRPKQGNDTFDLTGIYCEVRVK